MEVRAYLGALRSNGSVVTTAIGISCAEGIVKNIESNLLACNGGPHHSYKALGQATSSPHGVCEEESQYQVKDTEF